MDRSDRTLMMVAIQSITSLSRAEQVIEQIESVDIVSDILRYASRSTLAISARVCQRWAEIAHSRLCRHLEIGGDDCGDPLAGYDASHVFDDEEEKRHDRTYLKPAVFRHTTVIDLSGHRAELCAPYHVPIDFKYLTTLRLKFYSSFRHKLLDDDKDEDYSFTGELPVENCFFARQSPVEIVVISGTHSDWTSDAHVVTPNLAVHYLTLRRVVLILSPKSSSSCRVSFQHCLRILPVFSRRLDVDVIFPTGVQALYQCPSMSPGCRHFFHDLIRFILRAVQSRRYAVRLINLLQESQSPGMLIGAEANDAPDVTRTKILAALMEKDPTFNEKFSRFLGFHTKQDYIASGDWARVGADWILGEMAVQ